MTATSQLQFLQNAAEFPKLFWKSRDSSEAISGYGKGSGEILWGGQAFSSHSCQGIWSSFPTSLFFSPKKLEKTSWSPTVLPFRLPKLLKREDLPTFRDWSKQVENVTHKIARKAFEKVVLARQTTLSFSEKIDPYQIMNLLNPLGKETSLFFLQIDPETAFVGASPEKLFHRQQDNIKSEAIAGTQSSLGTWTPKESAELEPVQKFIDTKLSCLCKTLRWHRCKETLVGQLKHLSQSVEGMIKTGTSDQMLLDALHPTPALGGFPQQEALQYLSENEPFPRGWYGGVFGRRSPSETDLAVTIRSALISGSQLHLFAGVGIVKDSNPAQEWEELDRKIDPFMRYL